MPTDKSRFSMEQGPLNEKAQEVAKNELRESPEQIEQSLAKLKELLAEQSDLHYKTDDDFLIRFLRPTKYYPESALALMRRAADFKVTYAQHVKDLVPEQERTGFIDNEVCNVLVDRDQHGRRMLIVNCGGLWDPRRVNADSLFRMFYLIHLAAMMEPETQVCGVVVIMDFNGLSMRQVAALSPGFCMKLLSFIQEAMPLRMKAAHIVMQPFLFNMVFTMFRPFIREKLKNRMFFHGKKMESLHQHIHPDYLPSNYGGTLPAIDYTSRDWYPAIDELKEEIKAYLRWKSQDTEN